MSGDSPQLSRRESQKHDECIAAVVIVLGMFMTAGTTNHARRTLARIYEPHRVSWAELREGLYRLKAFGKDLRMS